MREISCQDFEHARDFYFQPSGEWARTRVARILEAAAVRPGERILDLGCSLGCFSFHAHKAGGLPIGLDRDLPVLQDGREIQRMLGESPTPRICGDATALPFRPEFFDLVLNIDFIEHTTDTDKPGIFSEMHRVLKRGGRALVYSPNLNRVNWELRGERTKRLLGLRREPVPDWRNFVDPDHFGLTTPGPVTAWLRAAGFHTRLEYFEFHIPLLSRLPGVDALASGWLSSQFANRYLVFCRK